MGSLGSWLAVNAIVVSYENIVLPSHFYERGQYSMLQHIQLVAGPFLRYSKIYPYSLCFAKNIGCDT
jgi:hypothetical protein